MASAWEKIESQWPARIGEEPLEYVKLTKNGQSILNEAGISPLMLSHIGIVVSDIDTAAKTVSGFMGEQWQLTAKDWVESYSLYVARGLVEGKELELIAPTGKSNFLDFLHDQGQGLHHISFQVSNIQDSLEKLKLAGVTLLDEKPRTGSHGKIAFVQPTSFSPLSLELCQVSS